MNHDIRDSPEVPLDLILNGIREVVGPVHIHLWINEDMEINVDIVTTTSASNLMTFFDSSDGKDDPLDRFGRNGDAIAEYAGALL